MVKLRRGDRRWAVTFLQRALNARLKARNLPTITVTGVVDAATLLAAQRVGRALGALEQTLLEVRRDGTIPVGLQRIIRFPATRNAAQLQRARDRNRAGRAPRIITAAQLGLTFQWVFGDRGPITKATGHYTGGPRARNAAEGIRIARQVHAQHRAQGWGGASYDTIDCDDGTLILLNPPRRKSAHVAGANTGNAAFNCPGTTGDAPTEDQAVSFRWYLANAHTRKVPAAHRQPRDLRTVRWLGHNDQNATACPGLFKRMFTTKGASR